MKEVRPKGEGWKTYEEVEAEWKIGHCKARKLLRDLIQAGRIQKFSGKVAIDGKLVQRVWYRKAAK